MNFRALGSEEVDINLTPLIDVVFLLLIFFMVSTTFIRESEIELTLPEASADVREHRPETIDIAVDASGRVFIDGKALINTKLATISQALREIRSGKEEAPIVVINADAQASHQAVITVMDAARQAGLTKITFPTRQREE